MTISVGSMFDKAEIKEDQTTEYKRSIFIDPATQAPGFRQMMTIAETLAAFMNADGGMLYVGVADNKDIHGIADDLAVLACQPTAVAVRSVRYNDETFSYGGTNDKYELKIRAIVKAYLSSNASGCLGRVEFGKSGMKTVCRIEAKKCKADDFVYVYRKYGAGKSEVAEIYKRFGNQKRKLEGEERDAFVRERTRQQVLANVNAVVAQNPKGLVDQVLAAIENAFKAKPIGGGEVLVEGAVAVDDRNFTALKSPKGLVFDGKHVCDVASWKEAFGALLVKLNEIDASKFDGIAAEDFFNRWFVEVQPHKKYGDYFKDKLGTAANVRGYVKVGKINFSNPDYVVHRLLARFGIDPGRVALRG